MAAAGITIVIAMPYRGGTEEWSQRYHLDSGWGDHADFPATAIALMEAMAPILPSSHEFQRAYGYDDTDDDSFGSTDLTGNHGTFSPTTGNEPCPGDAAVWTRWYTERHSSAGRKIYLRKYWHGCWYEASGSPDVISSHQKDLLETFAADATGTGWDGRHLAGPDGNVPGGGSAASSYITTRTLKRRGRRP